MDKIVLTGLLSDEITQKLDLGQAFRGKQIFKWVGQGVENFDSMTNLSLDLRNQLKEKALLRSSKVSNILKDPDGTIKLQITLSDNNAVETVLLTDKEGRKTACVSCQAGCAMKCAFCMTGTLGLSRNLEAYEIVEQFLYLEKIAGKLDNIVFMGMGEPLLNYENVKKGLQIIMDPEGIAISRRRITLSTSGIAPIIPRIAEDLGVKLAVSLHAPTNEIRDKIMPVNRKYPLEELMAACKKFQEIGGTRQYITMEYVMLDGINDSEADAKELIRLVKGLAVKFNLIPFNEWKGCPFKCSPKKRIERFSALLEEKNYAAPIRVSRGQDIMAACGQLKTAVSNS